jgi:hypothetical protein
MEIQTISKIFEKLEKSKEYSQFKNENKEAFFCAGFFILNFKNEVFDYSLDFRDEKELFTFKIPFSEDNANNNLILQKEPLLEGRKPLEKLYKAEVLKIKLGLEGLKSRVEAQLLEKKISNKLNELIAVIQTIEGKLLWNITAMAEGFVIISIQIDAISGELLKFDKRNLLDFVSIKKPENK